LKGELAPVNMGNPSHTRTLASVGILPGFSGIQPFVSLLDILLLISLLAILALFISR